MLSECMTKITRNAAKLPGSQPFYTKSTSLKATIIADFGSGVEISKYQLSNFYLKIQRIDAINHIYVSHWPVTNIKASFCA